MITKEYKVVMYKKEYYTMKLLKHYLIIINSNNLLGESHVAFEPTIIGF